MSYVQQLWDLYSYRQDTWEVDLKRWISQATAGDVRFMIPCTKDAASRTILDMDATSVISNAFGLPSGTAATLLDKDAEPPGPEQPDPCFLVVILSGFNVSSQADDAQLRALNSGGSVRASGIDGPNLVVQCAPCAETSTFE